MIKYHLSPVTGRMEKCSAVKQPCRYGGRHYPSREAGEQAQEGKDKFLAEMINQREVKAQDSITLGDILAQLAGDPDWSVRLRVAEKSDTPGEILTRLAGDPKWEVRAEVGKNPNTPEEALDRLADDPDGYVRWVVAVNSNTVLARLAEDPDWYVRLRVAENPNTPLPFLPGWRKTMTRM